MIFLMKGASFKYFELNQKEISIFLLDNIEYKEKHLFGIKLIYKQ